MSDIVEEKCGTKVLYEVLRESYQVSHESYAEEQSELLPAAVIEGLAKFRPQSEDALQALVSVFQEVTEKQKEIEEGCSSKRA